MEFEKRLFELGRELISGADGGDYFNLHQSKKPAWYFERASEIASSQQLSHAVRKGLYTLLLLSESSLRRPSQDRRKLGQRLIRRASELLPTPHLLDARAKYLVASEIRLEQIRRNRCPLCSSGYLRAMEELKHCLQLVNGDRRWTAVYGCRYWLEFGELCRTSRKTADTTSLVKAESCYERAADLAQTATECCGKGFQGALQAAQVNLWMSAVERQDVAASALYWGQAKDSMSDDREFWYRLHENPEATAHAELFCRLGGLPSDDVNALRDFAERIQKNPRNSQEKADVGFLLQQVDSRIG